MLGTFSSVGAVSSALGQEEENALEEISITGTRIRRQDYNSANPVATFGSEELQNLGIVNIADAITQMPSNVSQFTTQNTGGSAFFIGSTLANLRGLNPFFGTRTLTLVDSRRHVPTNQGGSVDLNFIPAVLINRMETVTGGASASYGSEAISGVVNILLDTEFEGFKFDADYGTTNESDGDNVHYGLAWGSSFGEGRGHFIVGGEFQDQDPILDCSTARDWCARSVDLFANGTGGGAFSPVPAPYVPRIPGEPHQILMSNLRYATSERGMIYNPGAGAQTFRFNDAGTDIVPFDAGEFAHVSPSGTVIGGEGKSIYDHLTIMPEQERSSFMAHASWEFTPELSGFVEVSYGTVDAINRQDAPPQNTVNMCIQADNAFLQQGSAAMQAEMAALAGNSPFNPFGCFTGTVISKDFTPETNQTVSTDTEVQRWAAGLSGSLFDDWTWDFYVQYGTAERKQIGADYRTNHRFNMALDSVIDPDTGQPVCRVTLNPAALPVGADPSLANGCVPLNPFGINNISPQALAYAYGSLTEFNEIDQTVAEFNVSGEVWEGWGHGAMLMAAGVQYRVEELVNDAGPLPFAQRTDFGLQYGDAFGGEVEVWEYFAEAEMPLLSDMPLAEIWSVNAAVRRAEYTNTGGLNTSGITVDRGVTSWKLSSVWDPVNWLRFRGSVSRDIRAPGFRELYYSQSIPSGGFFGATTNPWLPDTGPQSQRDETVIILSGEPRLEPEKADTKTFGVVVTPDQLIEGLQFSVDYYNIDLEDGIALGSSAAVVNECFAGVEYQCDYITFGAPDPRFPDNPNSNVVELRSPYINARPYESSGVDIAVNYNFAPGDFVEAIPGEMSVRLLSTYAIETLVQSNIAVRDIAGQTGGDQGFLSDFAPSADWASNLIITWMNGPVTLTTQARYTSDGILDLQTPKTGPEDPGYDPGLTNSVTSNRVPSHTTWNMTAAYNREIAGGNVQFYLNVNNLFDRDPPFANGSTGGANPVFFDAMGRTYRLGIRSVF